MQDETDSTGDDTTAQEGKAGSTEDQNASHVPSQTKAIQVETSETHGLSDAGGTMESAAVEPATLVASEPVPVLAEGETGAAPAEVAPAAPVANEPVPAAAEDKPRAHVPAVPPVAVPPGAQPHMIVDVPPSPPPPSNALKRLLIRLWRRWTAHRLHGPTPKYGLLFFDHLYSEYLGLESTPAKEAIKPLLESIHARRLNCTLTWSDIYAFDLSLLNVRPFQNLIRKAYDARERYRNIAGQKEYDEYIASKPPDLATVPADSAERLRADIGYLLSKFYLYYSMLPVREKLRDFLTIWGVIITGVVAFLIAFAIAVNVWGSDFPPQSFDFLIRLKPYSEILKPYSVVLVTVLTVALSGVVGGCVSMLQRIQSAPSEGDALFNMAGLKNGWRAIILSPLYGGIFALLLFVLFAAGVLKGSVFPAIITPPEPPPQASPSPTLTPTSNPSAPPTPLTTSGATNPASAGSTQANRADKQTSSTGLPTPVPTPTPTSSPAVSKQGILQIKDFLQDTGPRDGVSYSLLIVWSFLAGFLERLVPDTLNRLVAKNEAIQGTNT